MKLALSTLVTLISLLVVFPKEISASLIRIDPKGNVILSVLGDNTSLALEVPRPSELRVKELAVSNVPSEDARVSLKNSGGSVKVIVTTDGKERELEVNSEDGSLVQVEERPEVQKIEIGISGDKFKLTQGGVIALTSFPINIDGESAHISVSTETGERFLSILPKEAVASALRSKSVSSIQHLGVEILENERELQYSVSGTKALNFFDVYAYEVPVKTYVSASTGEILKKEQPVWLSVVDFLFI